MISLRLLAPALFLAAPAGAQVAIDSHGIRTPGATVDASGIRTNGTRVDADGIHPGDRGGRVINTNNGVARIDCAGGALTVNGNGNRLTVANCRAVTVAGNHNTLTARFPASGRLTVLGNWDQVSYTAGPRVTVAVSNIGTRSSVTRR